MSEEKQQLLGEEGIKTDLSSIHQPQDKPASTTPAVKSEIVIKVAEATENQKVSEKSEDKNPSHVISIKGNSASQLVSGSVISSGKEDGYNNPSETIETKEQDKNEERREAEGQNDLQEEAALFKDIVSDESQE